MRTGRCGQIWHRGGDGRMANVVPIVPPAANIAAVLKMSRLLTEPSAVDDSA